MTIDIQAAAGLLADQDDVLIIPHRKPDGDALGSAFALLWALEKLGRRTRVESPDGLPERYRFLFGDYRPVEFPPRFAVSVDAASPDLLGELAPAWADKLDLCIDHHLNNTMAASYKLVLPDRPATAQIIHGVIGAMGVGFDPRMATAIFAGLTTDTGCFKFYSVTADTHRAAADMIDAGAEHGLVNMLMFDQKSRGRAELEKIVYNTLEFRFGGLLAAVAVESEAVERYGVTDAEMDGISSYPRMIEGVLIGITLREKPEGCRVSVRTRDWLDASALCARFGGGGHKNAGGCTIEGRPGEALAKLLPAVEEQLREAGITWRD